MNTTSLDAILSTLPPCKWLVKMYSEGSLEATEVERCRLGAAYCALEYSSSPWHQQRAKEDPEYWHKFFDSQINSLPKEIWDHYSASPAPRPPGSELPPRTAISASTCPSRTD